jgi:toxin YoeB
VRLVFTPQGWDDYCHWQQSDRSILKRINRLIDDALRDPTSGIGKPEPLKYGIIGAWSRRITDEHRLVYRVLNDDLVILQGRYHYQGPRRTQISPGSSG